MPKRITRLCTVGLLLASIATSQSPAPPRLHLRALDIGNDRYPSALLKNAGNDASAMYQLLTARGFAASLLRDATLADLQNGIKAFATELQPKDTVVIYYSGHGIQIANDNYLVPVDFSANTDTEAKHSAVSVTALLSRVYETQPQLTVLILDACRDNPFLSSRSLHKGLAAIPAAEETYIAYATSPGHTASDNPTGQHGLFTQALINTLQVPGLDIESLFREVRKQVYDASQGTQRPYSSSNVIGSFSFTLGSDSTTNAFELARNRSAGRITPPSVASVTTPTPPSPLTSPPLPPSRSIRSLSPTTDIEAAIKAKEYATAIVRTDLYLKTNPQDPRVLYLRGLTAGLLGNIVDARGYAEQALRAGATFPEVHVLHAATLLGTGRFSECLVAARQALIMYSDPSVVPVTLLLAIKNNCEGLVGVTNSQAVTP